VTLAGTVPEGRALLRAGARPGNDVWVSGTPGDAAAGLAILQGRLQAQGRARDALLARFQLPQARVALGIALRGIATACIDVSDGLVGDLGKLCAASGVGADVESRELPLSAGLCSAAPPELRLACALGGGDDYELLFTAPQAQRAEIEALAAEHGLSGQAGALRRNAMACVALPTARSRWPRASAICRASLRSSRRGWLRTAWRRKTSRCA
jgi:thiamine-monophosphate kinase